MSLPPIGLLTVVTFLPAVGALLILLLVPRRHEEALRWGGLVVSLATFAASVPLWTGFDAGDADMQFEELLRWMPGLGVGYHVGVDGISVLLVLLTTFLMPVALASAWHAIEDRTKEFVIAMLLLEVGMVGVFVSFDLAFAIKVPLFPFHTWLPDAHVEAPTAGSVILAGVLLKMGTYGFLRFCLPLFPDASVDFGPWVYALAVIGIVYGAFVSTVQPDLKKLVAYSSVSHLGFVMLGLFTLTPQGLVGGVIQMVNHGLSTGALFLMVGMIYERRHTRLISEFGGLWAVIPGFSALLLIVCLSSLGLPGLNGFVGEFLILVGTFSVNKWLAAAATTGIIFAAVYLLWMYQRVAFGEIRHEANRRLADLTPREWAVLVPVLVLIVWIGVYPKAFTAKTEASVLALIAQVESKAAVARAPLPWWASR